MIINKHRILSVFCAALLAIVALTARGARGSVVK